MIFRTCPFQGAAVFILARGHPRVLKPVQRGLLPLSEVHGGGVHSAQILETVSPAG